MKSFYTMIKLKENILKGLNCFLATSDTKRTKKDFEYITGSKLKLEKIKGNENLYKAYL
jgi:hypothetical protein